MVTLFLGSTNKSVKRRRSSAQLNRMKKFKRQNTLSILTTVKTRVYDNVDDISFDAVTADNYRFVTEELHSEIIDSFGIFDFFLQIFRRTFGLLRHVHCGHLLLLLPSISIYSA